MSAAGLAPRDHARDDTQVGETVAAWRVAPNSLMLLSWQRESPALEGTVALQPAGGQPGRFTRLAWPAASASARGYNFLAAVQLPKAEMQAGDTLLMTGRRAGHDGVLARLPPFFLDSAGFAAELARVAADAAPAVACFLLEIFTPATMVANPGIRAMVAAFLEHASVLDGCVEILGVVREHYALLQGWGLPLQGGCEVILAGIAFRRYRAREACFARPDIFEPSLGHALVLPAEAAEAGVVECVFLLTRDGIRRRPVLPERRKLSETDTSAHGRDMLPQIRCDAETRAILVAALRPRYDGRLTLHERGHPVRLNVDLAVSADMAGSYLTGWLYDPAGLVESVRFRSTLGVSRRLDDCWTRIPRQDVTDGFSADPNLPACEPGRHSHGFAVQVPQGSSSIADQPYLEVALHDGWCGFVPLNPAPMNSMSGAARLLASVDLHKPSGSAVIERQLAPFFSRIAAPPPALDGVRQAWPQWSSLIVVPLSAIKPPHALLSQLLRDPLDGDEGILFVCGESWTDAGLAVLERLARFYGAAAMAVRVAGPATVWAALTIATEQSDAEHILLLGPGTVSRSLGWRRALLTASREQGGTACVSPTVLYEDNSIRFAGCDGVEPLAAAPYVRLRRHLAGLPASFAPPGPAAATAGVSASCCLIPRTVLTTLLGQVATAATSAWEPELDLLLQLKRANAACWWVPDVQVYAPDDLSAAELPDRTTRLVGRWCVRAQLTTGEG